MIRRGLEWFGGSFLVYVLVAACAASGDKMDQPWGEGDASSGATSSGDGDQSLGDGDEIAQGNSGGMNMGDGDTSTGNHNSGGNPMIGDGDAGGMMGMIMDPVPDADAAEDGTRIVNLYRTTAGGLRAWEGFYDKVLEVPCGFQRQTDGKEYCVPLFEAYAAYTFIDSGCTQPVLGVPCGSRVPTTVVGVIEFTGTCGAASYAPYRIGSAVTPSAIYTKTSVDGDCTEGTPIDGYTYYSVGEKIATGDLVEGTTDHD